MDVGLDFEPPQKWPLWFYGHPARDVEDLAPVSPAIKQLARLVNAYFATNTDWCDPASQYYFLTRESYVEFNRLAHDLATRLVAELGSGYKVQPNIAKINETGHVYLAANRENRLPKNIWVEHNHP